MSAHWLEAYLWICLMVTTMWGLVEIAVYYIDNQ